jgi:vacuolar-type H+-ATPase subunit I/STV1
MLSFMSDPAGPAAVIPPAGWYPDPWFASQQRYWSGEWTAWTAPAAVQSPFYYRQVRTLRKLGALDSFGVTVGFLIQWAGFVVFWVGVNPDAIDSSSSSGGPSPPFLSHPGLSAAGAFALACGLILSVVALCRLRNTEGRRRDLWGVLAWVGVILPPIVFVLSVAGSVPS